MNEEKEMFEFLEDRGLFNYLYDEPTEKVSNAEAPVNYPADINNNEKNNIPHIIWQLLLHFCGQEGYKEEYKEHRNTVAIISIISIVILTIIFARSFSTESGNFEWLFLGYITILVGLVVFILLFGNKIALSKAEKILGISNNQNVYVVTFYSIEKAKLTGVDYKDNEELIFRCNYELNGTTHDHWFSAQEVFLDKADAYAKYSAQFEKRVSVLCDVLNIDRSRAEKFLLSAAFVEYAKVKFQYGNSVAYYQNGTSDDFLMSEKKIFDCLTDMKKKAAEKQKEADRQKSSHKDAVQTFNQMFSDE